jgi:hypothetical protein
MESSNATGADFEQRVYEVLQLLAHNFPSRVHVDRHPRLLLQNGEEVVPDFDLLVVQPHERQFYFVECQARQGFSKDILHKIQHIRAKSWRQTFLFVYPESIPAELKRALEVENVLHFPFAEFCAYIDNIRSALTGLLVLGKKDQIAPGLVLAAYAMIKSRVPLSVALEELSANDFFSPRVDDRELLRLVRPSYGQKDRGMLGGG